MIKHVLHHAREPIEGRMFWSVEAIAAVLVFLAIVFMPGCATIPKTVEVPVPVPCHVVLSPEAAYPDTDAALRAEADPFRLVQLLLEGRLLRTQRVEELSAAVSACQALPGAPASLAPKP